MLEENCIVRKLEDLFENHCAASMQVAMIHEGQVVINTSFGYKNCDSKEQVDETTTYSMASITKSFTACAIAKLVEEGLVEWDQLIVHYLPEFEMFDPYVTKHLTIRDILCHRSGLPRHDAVWYLNDNKTEDLIAKLKYLEPTVAFRGKTQYQNIMYALAGYLIELITGKQWADYVNDTFIEPLNMTNTFLYKEDVEDKKNQAEPHGIINDELKQIDEYVYSRENTLAAAGSIVSTASDMLKWLQFHLDLGKNHNQDIVGAAYINECQQPQMINTDPDFAYEVMDFYSYGFGWEIASFRGEKVIFHGGNIHGYSSMMAMIPNRNIGYCFVINTEVSRLQPILLFALLDAMLGHDTFDYWNKTIMEDLDQKNNVKLIQEEEFMSMMNRSKQILSNQAYVGEYFHDAYGLLEIFEELGMLYYKSSLGTIPMEHLGANTFCIKALVSAKHLIIPMHFETNLLGHVTKVHVLLEPALQDGISFRKI